jgi:hypothetical protein
MLSAGAMSVRFADVAEQAFSFLEKAGFRLAQRDSTRLQYESDHAVVVIEWDPRSGEMEASIGLPAKRGERPDMFSLSDLLNMQGVGAPKRRMPFQVADEDRIAPFLQKLAEDTRTRAQSALAGDRMFFRRLHTFRSAQSRAYMRDMELRRVRSEAERAWRDRELNRVISLYSSIENDLSELEKGKLDYARKHVGP